MNEKKYNALIAVTSVAIPVVVAILFAVKIPNAKPLYMLPPIYSAINGITAVLLLFALRAIKNRKQKLHQRLMQVCIGLSIAFLVMYVAYHMTSDPTPYGGSGLLKGLYYFILISHILLSVAIIPLVLISYVRALAKRLDKHRKIAKIAFPVWLYVAVSGVVVYLMIAPYYTY